MARVYVAVFEQLIPLSGGGTPRIRSIVEALVKRGHEVSVAASVALDTEDALRILKCNEVFPLKNVDRLDKHKMRKYFFLHPFNISKVVYEATKVKPDLIIAHNSIAGLASLSVKKLMGCLVIMDMTDLIFEYLSAYRKYTSWASNLYTFGRRVENKVVREADKIVTISKAMKNVLIEKGVAEKKVNIVYDGVSLDIFKPYKEEATILRRKHAAGAENVVMYHGVFDPQDCPEILVDAATSVLKEHPDTMFWLIGDGLAVPDIKEKAKRRGLEERFFFSGWVPFEEVPCFISACNLGLVILPDTLSARIRVTLKGFEYWACEKPIVVPKLPALKEIITPKNTGLFYKPGDYEDLAEKICFLLEDKRLCKKMGMAGRKLVEKEYGWNKLASEFVTICESML